MLNTILDDSLPIREVTFDFRFLSLGIQALHPDWTARCSMRRVSQRIPFTTAAYQFPELCYQTSFFLLSVYSQLIIRKMIIICQIYPHIQMLTQ